MEYIYGKNTVISYIQSKKTNEIYLLNGFNDKKILDFLKQNNINFYYKSKNFFDINSKNGNHQGIMATIESFKYATLEEIVLNCKQVKRPVILMLDKVEDPHNLGAIIRTCEAFSIQGVIISKHNSCPINSTVAKVSTGALNNVKIAQVNNLTNALKLLKDEGFWIYAAEANNGVKYDKVNYDSPTVLVVGSEGNGISSLVKKQSDFNIYIPMTGKVNSLNVSVATAILISNMYKSE